MCGIVGILAATGDAVDPKALQRMNDLLAHRGPDGEGFLLATGAWGRLRHAFVRRADSACVDSAVRLGLGHRRLAILDLSDRGLQPMRVESDRAWIVFNGEIYNHVELRSVLEARGYVFTTRTDTEVLLNAYLEWGEACLDHLEGMFAFAIWDDAAGRLFCARDRLGIKPFYYARPGGYFVFASEIKALTVFPQCTLTPDDEAVVGFLVHANCDYGQRTMFRDIHALPAAHSVSVEAGTGSVSLRRYWTPGLHPDRALRDGEHVEQVREALIASMRKHLISDVRVGSCLSGGLDSSTVVGLMGRIQHDEPEAATAMGDRLDTFTSCYDNKAFDEREFAMAVSRSVSSTPHLVFPSPEDFWADFQRMAWHQDMPFGALSYYAQWRVMRAAKEAGVKVLLDGQGGDEVFGGYAKFRYAYVASLGRSLRVGTMAKEVIAMVCQGDRYLLDIRNGYRYLPASVRGALNVDSVLKQVLIPDWHEATSGESTPATRWWRHARASRGESAQTLMQRIQIDDIVVDTLPQLLRMEDRSSMAFSLEARVPLLDHNVVDLGLALPDHMKVNRGWSKFAIRQAMAGLIPESVRLRKTKLGFAAPDRAWLGHDLRPHVTELLASDLRCRRYIDAAALRRWYGDARSLRANTESYLGFFRVLSLEMWMRAFSLS
jgi:asparagine synthase (glutamine-hydrolysing)